MMGRNVYYWQYRFLKDGVELLDGMMSFCGDGLRIAQSPNALRFHLIAGYIQSHIASAGVAPL
ncbi:MAG: hypothetical protein EA411_12655 [Saprospirales bacterium]|nr:MAG: hypothetical protein EA411_12655 [Saprospirales bacterium]